MEGDAEENADHEDDDDDYVNVPNVIEWKFLIRRIFVNRDYQL